MSERPSAVPEEYDEGGESSPLGQSVELQVQPGALRLSGSRAELTTGISYSREPGGTWTVERAREERKDRQTEHQQSIERLREAHTLKEEAEDRKLIRRVVYGLASLVLAAFLFLAAAMTWSENDGRQEWAQESLVVLFTATVSAVAGWFANRKR